mmetsp:Transcript_106800/g.341117  ORF Transcript_106800/g.341117 Transcript_106800/m.341117 type:complete len:214 (+) Transcript_106800:97-738(+)
MTRRAAAATGAEAPPSRREEGSATGDEAEQTDLVAPLLPRRLPEARAAPRRGAMGVASRVRGLAGADAAAGRPRRRRLPNGGAQVVAGGVARRRPRRPAGGAVGPRGQLPRWKPRRGCRPSRRRRQACRRLRQRTVDAAQGLRRRRGGAARRGRATTCWRTAGRREEEPHRAATASAAPGAARPGAALGALGALFQWRRCQRHARKWRCVPHA